MYVVHMKPRNPDKYKATPANIARAKKLLSWAAKKEAPSAMAWAERQIAIECGLDLEMKPLTPHTALQVITKHHPKNLHKRAMPNTTFWNNVRSKTREDF